MSTKTYPTLQTESRLFERGNRFVIGIDEVGRGAIAGPVAVGLSLIDKLNPAITSWPEKLQDSKLMTPKSRAEITDPLENWVDGFAIGYSSNEEIDKSGISEALRSAASRALTELLASGSMRSKLASEGAVILLDGSQNWLGKQAAGLEVDLQVKADTTCVSVAAAAVLAKVKRDALMEAFDGKYPEYGFAGHKGYASAAHIQALRTHGPSAIHRLTWLTRILA
ncbi:RnhB Ribonuclease HII [Microbacteriaceae bacterium]